MEKSDMILTKNAIRLMREQIEGSPIKPEELRRVTGMGNLFMSPTRFAADEEGEFVRLGWTYWEMYSLKIDGTIFYFYGGTPNPTDDTMADPT